MNIAEIIDKERKSLLQLTGSSPSINIKEYKAKGLKLTIEDAAKFIFDFVEGIEFIIIPSNVDASKYKINPEKQKLLLFDGPEEELLKRLQKTKSETKLAQEEHGINILNLAIGIFTWKEDERAEKLWNSPLVLLPVKLEKEEKNGRIQYAISYNEEAIEPNHALIEALRTNHKIELPEMPDWETMDGVVQVAESWNSWIGNLKTLTEERISWEVKEQQVSLSFFTFAKFQMYKDLSAENWPTELSDSDNNITIAKNLLVGDGFTEDKSIYTADFFHDKELPADQPTTIEKLDSSQAAALLESRTAKCLVIEGPPGTGKSTTITNIIADAILQGKKVLFVAEKMAALDAVKNIFVRNQLGHLCLEIHGNKTQKTVFVEGLRKTIEEGNITAALPKHFDVKQLNKERDELRKWSDTVNTPGKNGYSPFELFGLLLRCRQEHDTSRFVQLGRLTQKQVSFAEYIANLNKKDIETEASEVKLFTEHLNEVGHPLKHSFYGCEKTTAPLQSEQYDIIEIIKDTQSSIKEIEEINTVIRSYTPWIKENSIDGIGKAIQLLSILLSVPDNSALLNVRQDWIGKRKEIEEIITAGEKANAQKTLYKDKLHESAWQENIREQWTILSITSDNLWNKLFNSGFKKAKNFFLSLYKNPASANFSDFPHTANAIFSYQDSKALTGKSAFMQQFFGSRWKELDSDWQLLQKTLNWQTDIAEKIANKTLPKDFLDFLIQRAQQNDIAQFEGFYQKLTLKRDKLIKALAELRKKLEINPSIADDLKKTDLSELSTKLGLMVDQIDQLPSWVRYYNHCLQFNSTGKDWLVQAAENWEQDPHLLLPYYLYSVWEYMLQQIILQHPELQQMSYNNLNQIRESFIKNDTLLQEHYKVTLINKHVEALHNLGNIGQAAFIRTNLHKKRNIPTVRRFLTESFDAIASIKPVFMMSPLSVAGYLNAQPGMFDMVIFDEASQVEPMDALGAILRGKQVIVVGDTKQMPPTNFFRKIFEEDDEDKEDDSLIKDTQSVMELMLSRNARNRSLLWHYRSRHQSLIETSREHFYKNMLVYHSAIENNDFLGLKFNKLTHTTHPYDGSGTNKAEAKAVALATLEFAQKHPDKSLGIVAFNIKQKDTIDKEVELLAKDHPELMAFKNRKGKDELFIKNLENVQGDERDVIFISIGYGKTKDGSFSLNFGPLNKDGGERRFNVLITRARMQNRVFANFSHGEIDLSRSKAFGIKILKDFLHHAEEGKPLYFEPSQGDADSIFEEQVMDIVKKMGYEADFQVGSKGYKIDIAIKHPQQPGRYVLAVECDGAAYHSSKSARDRDRLRQSVLEQYGWNFYRIWSSDWFFNQHNETARLKKAIDDAIESIDSPETKTEKKTVVETESILIIEETFKDTKSFAPYTVTPTHTWKLQENFFKQENPLLERYMLDVIFTESPIHIDRIFQRLTSFQGTRQGSRIRQLLETMLGKVIRINNFAKKGDFIWTNTSQLTITPRDHSATPDKDIDRIAPEELKAALEMVKKSSFGATEEEVVTETLKRLGFSRISEEMQERMRSFYATSV